LSEVAELSGRAGRLAAGLAGERTITIRLDRLWEVFARSSPDIAREPAKRQLLLDAVSELEAARQITLPKGIRGWDRTGHPPLPMFVRREVDRSPSTAMRDGLRYPWSPQLSWAASERLTTVQREALMAVSSWITRHPDQQTPLAHRERSLEIFGQEKRLDELMPTPLFGPGRLTLDMLAAYVVHPPFVWQAIERATGTELLVIENHNTYDSVCRALAHHVCAGTGSPFRHVAYGAGGAFEASVSYIADLDPPPARVRYFGDLDAEGLTIPSRASDRARAAGLPPVEPHVALYQLLLTHGRPQLATNRPASTNWLGQLQQPVEALIASGHRLAQEWVNLSILRSDRTWLGE
jgi:hypothetical protein